jgi:LysM repeat protein
MKISAELSFTELPTKQGSGPRGNANFRTALAQAQGVSAGLVRPAAPPEPQRLPEKYTVRHGDTMFSIARRALELQGLDSGSSAATRAAVQLAKINHLANPDLIRPGQTISLAGLRVQLRQQQEVDLRVPDPTRRTESPGQRNAAVANTVAATGNPVNPVLEKMLDRAVALQYVDVTQKDAVRNKIIEMGAEYRFRPDDLATVMLMESDGMNPQASNGRCYGLIQFCEGANKGAASVGYADNPKAILKLGVLDQLDLVKKYFDETGLKKMSPATLDDLYLTVLKPASRKERDPNANLEIPGNQAALLYPSGDRSQPITRASLLAGLQVNARGKLASDSARTGQAGRLAAANGGGPLVKVNFSNVESADNSFSGGIVRLNNEL